MKLFLLLIMLIKWNLWTLALQFFVDMNDFFAALKSDMVRHTDTENTVIKEFLFLTYASHGCCVVSKKHCKIKR